MELSVSLETICRLIVRARELEAGSPTIEADEDEDPADAEDSYPVLEEEADTSVEDELRAALDELADEEIVEILALALVGRGTYDASEWDDALDEASAGGGDDAVEQLLDMPMLAAYLDAGLTAFDLSCEGVGRLE